jgi:ketosteroid isomerase-like protein
MHDVWSCEQRYWNLRTTGKIDEYMSLWDEEFTGWPLFDAAPITKAGIRTHIENEVADPHRITKVELDPLSVRIHGDFAFVFYRLKAADGLFRMHHTWHRTPEGWKIIAGMSARE